VYPIKVAVIGCGRFGSVHLRVLSSMVDKFAVVAVAESDEKKVDELKQKLMIPIYLDYEEMLEKAAPQAVVVAVPTMKHFPVVCDAINAGCHVLCEKPLEINSRVVTAMEALADSRHKTLMVGHTFLYDEGIRSLIRIATSGDLGRLRYATCVRTNFGPVRTDVDAVADLATHDISIMNEIFGGPPKHVVSAVGGAYVQRGVSDVAYIELLYGDVLVHMHVGWLSAEKVRTIEIVGDVKMARWDGMKPKQPVVVHNKTFTAQEVADEIVICPHYKDPKTVEVEPAEPLVEQARTFAEVIAGEKDIPRFASAAAARDVAVVLEKINDGIKVVARKERETWPR